jgi:SHS2 domain-containing protein
VPYRFLDHTADVAVELRAPTRDELFADALVAFTDTTTDPATVTPREAVRIEVEADDAESLLVEFLDELVYRFEVDGMLFREAEVTIAEHGEGEDGSLRLAAEARGEPYDPATICRACGALTTMFPTRTLMFPTRTTHIPDQD